MVDAGFVLDEAERLKAAFAPRNAAIQRNRDFVLGNQWTAAEKANLPEGVSPVVANYCWPVVQKNMTFLVGRPPEIAVPVSEDTAEARAYAQFLEKVLYGVWEYNRMLRRIGDMAQSCSVAGGQNIIADWDPIRRMVKWSTPLPERFYPIPLRDDEFLDYAGFMVEEHYSPALLQSRFPSAPRDEFKPDYEQDGLKYCTVWRYTTPEENLWVLASTGRVIDQRAGYGYMNAVYLPNMPMSAPGAHDALADVTPIIAPQRQLNQLLTLQQDVVELYADPPVILEGAGIDPNEVEWGPGLKLSIEKDGKAYFLQWEGTPPDFKEQVMACVSMIQDLSSIPDVAYGRYEASIQSGIALNTQFQPTRLMMAMKQNAWSDAFEQLHRITIRMMRDKIGPVPVDLYGMNLTASENSAIPFAIQVTSEDLAGYVRSKLVWPGMLPKDDVSEMQMVLQQYQANAISLHSLLEKLGFESPTDEIRRLKEELKDPALHPELQQPDAAAAAPGAAAPADPMATLMASVAGGGQTAADPLSAYQPAFKNSVPGLGAAGSNMTDEEAYAQRPAG